MKSKRKLIVLAKAPVLSEELRVMTGELSGAVAQKADVVKASRWRKRFAASGKRTAAPKLRRR